LRFLNTSFYVKIKPCFSASRVKGFHAFTYPTSLPETRNNAMRINQMDIVFIKQLQIDTVIGVYEWEKSIQQRLFVDLELSTDISAAAKNDDIRQTLDYAVISQRVKQFVTAKPLELIETVAEQVAHLLLTEFATTAVKVTVCKPDALSDAQTVGVTIMRSQKTNKGNN